MRPSVFILLMAGLMSSPLPSLVQASPLSNRASPLGVGLNGISYWSSEQPFLNVFKNGNGWRTQNRTCRAICGLTGEEDKVALDADGYPTSVTLGASGRIVLYDRLSQPLFSGLPYPYYPAGRYILLYDGEGTITYQFDAAKNVRLSRPGRDVLDVIPSSNGFWIHIDATDPKQTGNHIRNIRLVKAEQESLLNAGGIFNPAFIERIAPFHALNFMDWQRTNNSTQSSWQDRPQPSYGYYGESGVPIEIMVTLANQLHADAWFNIPHLATNDYVTRFAELVHGLLEHGQKVYLEYSNETWNFGFQQSHWITAQGRATWPERGASDFEKNRSWFGMRTVQICDIWKQVWGADARRIVCVMGSQAATPWVSRESLECPLWSEAPCSSHGINALAIAPYFGGRGVPASWIRQPDGGLSNLFAETMEGGLDPTGYPGGLIQEAIDWTTAQNKVAEKYGIELIAYEGGQHFAKPDDPALTALYIAANRDARMRTAYTAYLRKWRNAGGHLLSHFVDVSVPGKSGSWGALENVMHTSSQKYDALMNFIADNPCWWTGCFAEEQPR